MGGCSADTERRKLGVADAQGCIPGGMAVAFEQHDEAEELFRVIQWLTDEFGDDVDPRTIHQVAMEEIAPFDRAKVRLFVSSISWRLARSRLRQHLEGAGSPGDGAASAQSIRHPRMTSAEETWAARRPSPAPQTSGKALRNQDEIALMDMRGPR